MKRSPRRPFLFKHQQNDDSFRRAVSLNPCVGESIEKELEALEQVGRVTAADHRPVHAEFGFADVAPDPAEDPVALVGGINVASSLDDAWSRLKRTVESE